MSSKYLIFILFSILWGIRANGQESRALPFLYLDADARSAAMGETAIGEANGMYLYSNPTSFLAEDTFAYGSYSYGLYPKDENTGKRLGYHAISGGYRFGDQAVMAGFRYQGGLEIPRVDETGSESTPINPKDWSVDLGYTRLLGEHFSAFLKGGFIYSYLGRKAQTAGVSAGVYYRNHLPAGTGWRYTIGAGLYDFGGKLTYETSSYNLPSSVGLGGSMAMPFADDHQVNVSLMGRYFLLPSEAAEMVAGFGAEYELFQTVALRAGYYAEKASSYATFGLGIMIQWATLDIAYQTSGSKTMDERWRFGIGVKF